MKNEPRAYSMRGRLLLWLAIPLISLVCLSTAVTNHFAQKVATSVFDSFLLNSADSVAARLAVVDNEKIRVGKVPDVIESNLQHYGQDRFYFQIVDAEGRFLSGSPDFPSAIMKNIEIAQFRSAVIKGEEVRICRVPTQVAGHTFWVRVAETLNSRKALLAGLFWSILIPQIALIVLGCVSVWYGVTRNLEPLNKLSTVLNTRTKPDFSSIDIGPVPLELKPVTDALNQLFFVAKRQLTSQREFVANAAHQMRTPMTATKTYLEYLLKNETRPQVTETLTHLDETVDRSVRLINRLLILARAEGDSSEPASQADFVRAIQEAAKAIVPLAIASNIDLSFELPEFAVPIRAEEQDLREIVINLLDNAIKYTPKDGSVWVQLAITEYTARLTIEDTGPGIRDEEKERVFDRFYRSPRTVIPGTGLGLSIVKELTVTHGGTVKLTDRNGGTGTCVSITFPLAPINAPKETPVPRMATPTSNSSVV